MTTASNTQSTSLYWDKVIGTHLSNAKSAALTLPITLLAFISTLQDIPDDLENSEIEIIIEPKWKTQY